MNNETDISLKFTNKIYNLSKLEEYQRRLHSIKTAMSTMPKETNFGNLLPKDLGKTLNEIYKQITNNVRATASLTSQMKNLKNITKDIKEVSGSMFSNIKFGAIVLALRKVANVTGQLVNKSSSYLENVNLYQVAFNGAYQEADKFVNKLSEMYGLDESWGTRTVGIFRQLANAMGLANQEADRLSYLMTQMSIDISSLFNVDVDRASQILQSALAGQTRPIRSVTGADITMNTLQQTLNDLDIDRAINQLSFAEKRLVIIISLTRQLTQATGDWGRTLESPANQTRILSEQWERLTRSLGNVLLPIVAKILPYVNGILMALTEILDIFASLMGFKTEDYDYFTGMADSVLDLEEGLDGASESAKKLKQGLRGFDKLNVITTPSASSGGVGAGAGISGDILGAYNKAYDDYMSKLKKVKMRATEIRDSIMEWLGFTKQIDSATGDVSFKLKDGLQNIHLIGGAIATIVGFKLVKGIAGLVTGTSTLGKLLGTGGLFTALKKLIDPIKILGAKDGLKYIFLNATAGIKKFLPVASKVTRVVGGIVATVDGSKGVSKAFKNMRKEMNYAGKEATEYRKRVLETVAGTTLIGSVFGPVGAVVGALTGTIIAGVSAWKGYHEAVEELAKDNIFGSLSISMEGWTTILSNSVGTITDWGSKWGEVETNLNSLYGTFQTTGNELDVFGYKFGLLKQQISEEDTVAIKNAIEDMATSSSQIIQQTTEFDFQLWSDMFHNMDTITEEEEKNILQSILNYGNDQQNEIKTAQDNITRTYENAINTRGYLTDQEYNYIQEQLAKIRALTESEMTKNQANIEYYKKMFKDKSVKLDEESYDSFNKALENYYDEKNEIIENNYLIAMQSAQRLLDQGAIDQDKYQEMLNTAYDNRTKSKEELRTKLDEIEREVYNDLVDRYDSIKNKTDEVAKEEKNIIENILKNVNIDDTELRNKMKKAGILAGESFADGFGNGGAFSSAINISVLRSGGRGFASGGMPPVGQMFIANEKGPELVGQIGGKSFVANQNQMLDLIRDEISTAKGGGNSTYIIQVGDEVVATHTINQMESMARANGKPFVIGG